MESHQETSLSVSTCPKITVVVLCVCVCVCVCVCARACVRVCVSALAAAYLVYMSKVRQYGVPCRLLQIYIVWTCWKCLFGRYGGICLPQWSVTWLFLNRKHTNGCKQAREKWSYSKEKKKSARVGAQDLLIFIQTLLNLLTELAVPSWQWSAGLVVSILRN